MDPNSQRKDSNNATPATPFLKKVASDLGEQATRAGKTTKHILVKYAVGDDSGRSEEELKQQARKELSEAVERTNEVLATATTVFPFTMFPDTIILDRTKLTVTRRNFFMSSDVMSIRIEDILNVSASVGPFFGALTIATRVMSSDDHFTIRMFSRQDAIHMKHMIQGYVIARHNNIECEHLSKEELIQTLTRLGHDTNRERV